MTELPPGSRECFFISPIGDADSDIRHRSDAIRDYIVSHAAGELGLETVRADQISKPGQITLQVIDHLINAKAAVADLTGLNPNVFYELAVRHAVRLPTVLIAQRDETLPFDLAQMRTIFFDHRDLASADHCRKQIVTQLRSALEGAVDSPIATAVDLQVLRGGSAVERTVAGLAKSVTALAAEFLEFRTTSLYLPTPDARRTFRFGALEEVIQGLADIAQAAARDRDLEILVIMRRMGDAMVHLLRPYYVQEGHPLEGRLTHILESVDSATRDLLRRDRPDPGSPPPDPPRASG